MNLPRVLLTAVLATLVACSGSDSGDEPNNIAGFDISEYVDPGIEPWELVSSERVAQECGLDPGVLASIDASVGYSYAVVRFGKLCHEFYHPDDPGPDEIANNYSSTKTLSATLVGRVVRMSADLPRPLSDADRMDAWVDNITFNQDALVAHVLAMVGFNDSLAFGERSFAYDADGSREINRLSDVLEAVVAQDPELFGGVTTTGELAQRQLFDRLGMTSSEWDGESFGSSWHSNIRDMARLGLLLVNNGVWAGERLVDSEWVYKMTHPTFEDANTSYGYLTWTGANANFFVPTLDISFQQPLGQCDPPALWNEYPHTFSESEDCNYGESGSCGQMYDVGAWSGLGFGGQNITGHRGLQLVVVTRNAGRAAWVNAAWDLVRPALVAMDPVYQGDEEAFCADYSEGRYAPDLIPDSQAPRS